MIEIENVYKFYNSKDSNRKKVKTTALHDITLKLNKNCCYSLIGESGAGKTVLAKLILRLEKPSKGVISFNNFNIWKFNKKQLRAFRQKVQFVFQDSYSSLNPRLTISESLAEPIRNFEKLPKKLEREKIEYLVTTVGLPVKSINKYPHQFSGGEQKRICIARAIATNPELIIFDEAVSGIDSTRKKNILDLLKNLQQNSKSTYLFITHDLDVALYMSQNIIVMRSGRFVEKRTNAKMLNDFTSSYAQRLARASSAYAYSRIYKELLNKKHRGVKDEKKN
ncbi:ABC transporter ATP-binding protein [Clostridium sp. 'deep sea']|uniref:ABC transporter ATP-binding protein n=1 Tax=Clostridium sp. 'deep sea' TaxID=2779445 RepID=UPI00189684A9|nr:dipeptide/oligopeptide/nickel ABC transporter ATP-binding protein [Clostridium sp. 'deep sea']QOR34987.1 ABC transporter ATP-binding protein [Clostridium sp. 'deep sea']